ncbi:Mevalonate/galactokinase family protein [Anopheles sinensis]|uniref:Mevalonate/galactokinase family protein n=1 Tax=Anopheles sinensis TaxID=74873 RepID=A0A084WRE2_ANOSI|nr:Mevalonate/galactokinase family protein [Anopheles sinensis]
MVIMQRCMVEIRSRVVEFLMRSGLIPDKNRSTPGRIGAKAVAFVGSGGGLRRRHGLGGGQTQRFLRIEKGGDHRSRSPTDGGTRHGAPRFAGGANDGVLVLEVCFEGKTTLRATDKAAETRTPLSPSPRSVCCHDLASVSLVQLKVCFIFEQ